MTTTYRNGGGAPSLVQTDRGWVRGAVDGDAWVFQDIPYAAAPMGELRWRSPQPASAWDGVRDATRPGDMCPQLPGIRPGTQSEECLNIKVTTPSLSAERLRPVMVMLDAGGLAVSSNANVRHHRLATAGDVVVVQPNERIGVFGFLAHPQMNDPAAGAFGIQDQQAALRWVQRNIAAFGGDPDNVTLVGISGGGVCTCANMMSPDAAGLFHRAIVHSGPFDTDFASVVPGEPSFTFLRPLEQIERGGEQMAADLGCADADDVMGCLRNKPISAFDDNIGAPFGAIAYGNAVLPVSPREALRSGRFHRMPVMMGSTSDEFTFYINLSYPEGIDEPTYRELLDDGSGNDAKVLARYPIGDYESAAAALSAAQGDRYFVLRTWQSQQALSTQVPVFAFEFADRTVPLDPGYHLPAQDEVSMPYGAHHGSDFQYLIDTDEHAAAFDQEQARLAEQIIEYWTAFAYRGDPNTTDQPAWPPYDAAAPVPHVQRLRTAAEGGIGPMDFAAEHRVAFWDELYPAGL